MDLCLELLLFIKTERKFLFFRILVDVTQFRDYTEPDPIDKKMRNK